MLEEKAQEDKEREQEQEENISKARADEKSKDVQEGDEEFEDTDFRMIVTTTVKSSRRCSRSKGRKRNDVISMIMILMISAETKSLIGTDIQQLE